MRFLGRDSKRFFRQARAAGATYANVGTAIPATLISGDFMGGPVLICAFTNYSNSTGVTQTGSIACYRDGVSIGGGGSYQAVANGGATPLANAFLDVPPPGRHVYGIGAGAGMDGTGSSAFNNPVVVVVEL